MIASLLFAAVVAVATERGAPILADDFSAEAKFPEIWKVGNKDSERTKVANGRLHVDADGRVVNVSLRKDLPDEIYVECDLAYEEADAKDCWAALAIDGHLFVARPKTGESWLIPDKKAGAIGGKGVRVGSAGYRLGNVLRLGVSRCAVSGVFRYAFLFNGMNAGSFVCPKPDNPSIVQLRAWNCRVWFDEFGLFSIKSASASPNLIYNASCERDNGEGLPVFFNNGSHFPFGKVPVEKYESEFLNAFGIDETESHSGRRSLRVEINECQPEPVIWTWGAGMVKDLPGVFSVYMKSSEENVEVELEYARKTRRVRVGKEWKRFEVVNPALRSTGVFSPVIVRVVRQATFRPATLWLDDFQAEIVATPPEGGFARGRAYATAFKLSDKDADVFGDKTVERAPTLKVPSLPAGMMPSERLDEWSRYAVVGELYAGNGEPRNRTRYFISCDEKNLYLGMRAYGEDPLNLVRSGAKRDQFSIYKNDALELFIAPTGKREWYHFMVNANGAATDLFREGIGWNGTWTFKAVKNVAEKSVDYFITFPVSDFAANGLEDVWYANFCRDDKSAGQASRMFKATRSDYRQYELWPELRFPPEVVNAWRKLCPKKVTALHNEGPVVVGRLNFYMNERMADFRVYRPDGTYDSAKVDISDLPYGTNAVRFSVGSKTYDSVVIKRPYRARVTRINHFARCLEREGQKILPFGRLLGLYANRQDPKDLLPVAELLTKVGGYRYLRCGCGSDDPKLRKYARERIGIRKLAVERYGFELLNSMEFQPVPNDATPEKEAEIMEWNEFLKRECYVEGALFSTVLDEPELRMSSDACECLVKGLRPHFAYQPMVVNYTHMGIPNNFGGLETDVLMVDDYLTTVPGRTVADSLVNVDVAISTAKRLHRPAFAFLVTGNTPYQYREPTRKEQVAQCYGALAGGLTGIILWGKVPYSRGDWEGGKQVAREMSTLGPYLLSEEPDIPVSVDVDPKKVRTRCVHAGCINTLLAVNVDEHAIGRVEIVLPDEFKNVCRVHVLFEDRDIEVRNGRFVDVFESLARHVYQWQ